MQTTPTQGFNPPVSENGLGENVPLELQWLSRPMVAVGVVDANTPFVTGALPRGAYVIWCSDAAWCNAGTDGVFGLDTTVTSANAASAAALARAPKLHEGGQWPVAIADGEAIALKAVQQPADTAATPSRVSSISFRIWEAL